jgi:hypothetical protein
MTSSDLYNAALKEAAKTLSDHPPLEVYDHRLEMDNMFCGDRVRIPMQGAKPGDAC